LASLTGLPLILLAGGRVGKRGFPDLQSGRHKCFSAVTIYLAGLTANSAFAERASRKP
jgi:hypothetical protein